LTASRSAYFLSFEHEIELGVLKMRSKWFLVLVLAIAVLCFGGACLEDQQETTGSLADTDSDPALGSTSPAAEASPASVAGSWSLILMDAASGQTRLVNLEMNQIDGVVFGRGSTSEGDEGEFDEEAESRPTEDRGIESMIWWLEQEPEPIGQTLEARSPSIGASGRVSGTSLSLDLVFLDDDVLYSLDLAVVGGSISGSYLAYDSLGRVRSGSCYGTVRAGGGQSAVPLGSRPEVIYLGGMRSR